MQYVRTLNMYTFCYSSNYSRTLYVYIHMPSTLQSFHERMEIKSKREFPRSREECIFLKKSQVLHSSKEKRLGVAFSISLSNNSFRAMWLGWASGVSVTVRLAVRDVTFPKKRRRRRQMQHAESQKALGTPFQVVLRATHRKTILSERKIYLQF